MGTISLPIPVGDYHRAGHPPAFAHGQPNPCPLCVAVDAALTVGRERAPKVVTRRAALKRPRDHDTGHVIIGIGYCFACSCGAIGNKRHTWREAMQEGREHAAAHTAEASA